ncbi:MAG: hypothetical protein K0Q76_892 [Panacagrimonas sp.]|jgi:hypothetical protein|nr:helix-turn-helix domain-containing protein [Panacagrimonas sp.]MCC2655784.1 hypothetical protein [Panacagrimonas sp.]
MDSLIAAASRALGAGDALGALKRVALRDDPPALALRGIAMAQLGEHAKARDLLRRAARAFGPREAVARARCVVAEAEVALALRDLSASPRPLLAAAATLDAHADARNALQARLTAIRRMVLLGRLAEAETALGAIDAKRLPPPLAALAAMLAAEIDLRALRTGQADAALERANAAATLARIPALQREVFEARAVLHRVAARRLFGESEQPLRLGDVELLMRSGVLLIDACRRGVRVGARWIALARRPVLFELVLALSRAWPGDVARETLIASVFRTRRPDETHRARLRVEMSRLRALLREISDIEATERGFRLRPRGAREPVVIAPPIDGEQASLLALLQDGAAWSTSALALAVDASQRTVQRALVGLESEGRVRSIGRARARRWLASPLTGFTTILLLPVSMAPA